MIAYLSVEQVLAIHSFQTRRFGGSRGVRDRGALESAVARPRATFGGEDLYPDLAAKAGALLHSLIANHPFVDGNKRVGVQALLVFLAANDHGLRVTPSALTRLALSAARGDLDAGALAIWIRQRLLPLGP